jgi:hypothetical protein
MRRTRWVIWLAGAALGAMLAAGMWVLWQDPFTQRVRLPDGSVLILRGVTYGKQHRLLYRDWRRELLSHLMPPFGRQSGVPMVPGVVTADTPNAVVFWVEERWTNLAKRPFVHYDVSDDDGREWRWGPVPRDYSAIYYLGTVEGVPMEAFVVSRFPRRSKNVRLHIHSGDTGALIGEFVAANPAPGPYPVWRAEPLPIARRAGELSVTLEKLLSEIGPRLPNHRARQWQVSGTEVRLRPRLHGRLTRRWQPLRLTLLDATGNRLIFPSDELSWEPADSMMALQRGLSTDEAPWKIQVEWVQDPRASTEAEETWTVRRVRVPRTGEATQWNARTTRRGLRLRLLGITGRRPSGPKDNWFTRRERNPVVRLQVSSRWGAPHLALRAVDDHGWKFMGYDAYGAVGDWLNPLVHHRLAGSSEVRSEYHFSLNIPPHAKKVDLTVVVPRRRVVEFVAMPSHP